MTSPEKWYVIHFETHVYNFMASIYRDVVFYTEAPAVGKVLTPPRHITYEHPNARRCKNSRRNYKVSMRASARTPSFKALKH